MSLPAPYRFRDAILCARFRADELVHVELDEAEREIDAFLKVVEIDVATLEADFELGEPFDENRIFQVQTGGQLGDFCAKKPISITIMILDTGKWPFMTQR